MWGWLGGQAWAASSEIYTYRRIALREPHRAPVPAWHTASTEISRHKKSRTDCDLWRLRSMGLSPANSLIYQSTKENGAAHI